MLETLTLWLKSQTNRPPVDTQVSADRHDKNSSIDYHALTIRCMLDGDYRQAWCYVDQAIRSDCQDASLYALRAQLSTRLGSLGAALNDLDRAILLEPRNATYYHRRGALHLQIGWFDRAYWDCSMAIELNSLQPDYYVTRAAAQRALGNPTDAQIDHDTAMLLNASQ